MNREECKQQIIERALAWMEETEDGGPPIVWTAADLADAASEMEWNSGISLDFDLSLVASTINSRWRERHPETSKPVPAADDDSEITTDRVDADQEPDTYVPDSEFPDYATNWDGTVICLGGRRKKKGKRMRPYAGWAKTSSGKFYPTCYFRLTKDGVRHIQTPAQMLMRRFKTLNPPKPKKAVEEVEETV